MSAAASLGLSLLWDTDVGLSHVDKYTYSAEEHIKVCVTLLDFGNLLTNRLGWRPLRYWYPQCRCTDRS